MAAEQLADHEEGHFAPHGSGAGLVDAVAVEVAVAELLLDAVDCGGDIIRIDDAALLEDTGVGLDGGLSPGFSTNQLADQ